jgi:hypothetical protein
MITKILITKKPSGGKFCRHPIGNNMLYLRVPASQKVQVLVSDELFLSRVNKNCRRKLECPSEENGTHLGLHPLSVPL